MGEQETEGPTRQEIAELRHDLDGLHDALQELRDASTSGERQQARSDVREAEADLDETAKRLGISRAALDDSIKAARTAERKEELREPLRELLDELRAEEAAAAEAEAATSGDVSAEAKSKPKAKPKPAEAAAAANGNDGGGGDDGGDSGPVQEHWGERRIGELLK